MLHGNLVILLLCCTVIVLASTGSERSSKRSARDEDDRPRLFLVKVGGMRPNVPLIRTLAEKYSIDLSSYIPYNTYIVSCTQEEAAAIGSTPGVAWVGSYDAEYKIAKSLTVGSLGSEDKKRDAAEIKQVTVMISRSFIKRNKELDLNELQTIISSATSCPSLLNVAHTESNVPRKIVMSFIATCSDEEIIKAANAVAGHRAVEHIEPKTRFHVNNYFAHGLIQSNKDPNVTTGAVPFFEKGINGTGHVIGCGDTGIDVHSCFFYDNQHEVIYYDDYEAEPTESHHRKIAGYMAFADDQDYVGGHGTHVTGSLAGMMTHDKQSHQYYKFHGNAPGAKIAFFDIGRGESISTPPSLLDYFPITQKMGARVHSNSWGSSSSEYTTEASEVDEYVWKHSDFLVLFAAGNDGESGPATVGTPATAKNILTVGAAQVSNDAFKFFETHKDVEETFKQIQSLLCSDPEEMGKVGQVCAMLGVPTPCVDAVVKVCNDMAVNGSITCCQYPQVASWCCPLPNQDVWNVPEHWNDNNVASFSSRGPVSDGRIKPDITCPGLHIWSAKSHGERTNETTNLCGEDIHSFDSALLSMEGTSMATPVCAGNALLLREYLLNGYMHAGAKNMYYGIEVVPAALLKALMINGAKAHAGVYQEYSYQGGPYHWTSLVNMTIPNHYEGYGKVNLANTVPHMDPSRPDFNVLIARDSNHTTTADNHTFIRTEIQQGQNSRAMCFKVVNKNIPVSITMTYTDAPGSPNARLSLVDDLDMNVYHNNVKLNRSPFVQIEDKLSNVEHAYIAAANTNDVFVVYISALTVLPSEEYPNGIPYYAVASGGIQSTACPSTCQMTCVNGTCVDGVCKCNAGAVGLNCDETLCPNDCSRNGVCNGQTGTCECVLGYTGNDCSEKDMCPHNCSNHGECNEMGCQCDMYWFGLDCASSVCVGEMNTNTDNGAFGMIAYNTPHGRVKCSYTMMPQQHFKNITLSFDIFNIDVHENTQVTIVELDMSSHDFNIIGMFTKPMQPFNITSKYSVVVVSVDGIVGPSDQLQFSYHGINPFSPDPVIQEIKPNFAVNSVDDTYITINGQDLCTPEDKCASFGNCTVDVAICGQPITVNSMYCQPFFSYISARVNARHGYLGMCDVTLSYKLTGKNYTYPDMFEFIEAIKVLSVTPSVVPVGQMTSFTIEHTPIKEGYTTTSVNIGECWDLPYNHTSLTSIHVDLTRSTCITTPSNVNLYVSVTSFGSFESDQFITAKEPGVISTVVPSKGDVAGQTEVIINGTGLSSGEFPVYEVTVCDIVAHIVSYEDDSVVILTPPCEECTICPIKIYSDLTGWSTKAHAFEYVYVGVNPVIDVVFPNFGTLYGDDYVQIQGKDLVYKTGSSCTVMFGDVEAVVVNTTKTLVVVKSPAHAKGSVNITVTSRVGTAVSPKPFDYQFKLISVFPPWLHLGVNDVVTIHGMSLSNGSDVESVTLAGQQVNFIMHQSLRRIQVMGDDMDTVTSGPIIITNSHGEVSGLNFTYCCTLYS